MKAEMKEKTMRMFLVSQKHIVYTEPLEICAGITVDVLYNPSNTVLNGRPEVWFRCSFNRWMHPGGVLPPQKMVKAENGSHLKATGLSFLRSCLLYYTFFVVLKDRRRRSEGGEWEPIKIPYRNLAYVPRSTRNRSLLTRSRPSSYRQAIGLRNWARNCTEDTKRC
jgi:hypothetical protein